jgi:hypothetical protein
MLHRSFADRRPARAGQSGCIIHELRSSFPLFTLRRCVGLWLGVCAFFTRTAAQSLPAQEERWKELNVQVVQLGWNQGRITHAESLSTSHRDEKRSGNPR